MVVDEPLIFNLHGFLPKSLVNGPGERFVIYAQGCSRMCPGCINPDALKQEPRTLISIDELFEQVISTKGIEGVSLSGGEPLEQMDAVIALCQRIRGETELSIVVYTGYGLEEIKKIPRGNELLDFVDMLVSGPFIEELRTESGLAGSTNQKIIFLTDRYSPKDIKLSGDFEIHLYPDGHLVMTGIVPEIGLH